MSEPKSNEPDPQEEFSILNGQWVLDLFPPGKATATREELRAKGYNADALLEQKLIEHLPSKGKAAKAAAASTEPATTPPAPVEPPASSPPAHKPPTDGHAKGATVDQQRPPAGPPKK